MAVLEGHVPLFREVFGLPGFFQDPVLVFGYHKVRLDPLRLRPLRELGFAARRKKLIRIARRRLEVLRGVRHPELDVPDDFRAGDLVDVLRARGVRELEVLDLFDPRATRSYDMNAPVPASEHERYGTLLDIGCLEHVFDTRQCIENCFRMVRTGGAYFVHTPVNGYFGHGLHTFNPEALVGALRENGFEIVYERYSTRTGVPLERPDAARDALAWIVARKTAKLETFRSPQQGRWATAYGARAAASAR